MKKLLVFISLLGIINSAAADDSTKTCVANQYIISGSVRSLREKAEALVEQTANKSFQPVDEHLEEGLVLLEETKDLTDGVNDAGDRVKLSKSNNICERLRRSQRLARREMHESGNLNIAMLRKPDCSCNEIQYPSDINTNDPLLSQLWGMRSSDNFGIGALPAWHKAVGNMNTVVAVIDTGVEYTHPDLIDNMWKNTGEIPNNGIDDDHNGYIDDYHGWNAITNTGDPMDTHGHGTHCAGTIGGRGNNGMGVAGVNWYVQIMPVKFLGTNGGTTFDGIKAIDYVTAQKLKGVNVILSSNSWGGGGYDNMLADAISRAKNAGLLFVAAAGNGGSDGVGDNNDSSPFYPASYTLDNIVSVAAISSNGTLTSFSNFGYYGVDIAAPGLNIISTYPSTSYVYASLSGTSMAAPHVSGALALLASYNPSLSWSQLRDIMYQTRKPLSSLQGRVYTGGIADVNAMLDAAYPPNQTPIPTLIPTSTPTARPPTAVPSATPTATPSATPTPGFYTVSGYAYNYNNGNGNPVPIQGAKVTMRYGNAIYTAFTDALGYYSFSNIQGPITYAIKITKPGYFFFSLDSLPYYIDRNSTRTFSGKPANKKLDGYVISKNQMGVAGISITLNGDNQTSVVTNSQGFFSFDAAVGMDYTLAASSEDYQFNNSVLSGDIKGDTRRVFVAR